MNGAADMVGVALVIGVSKMYSTGEEDFNNTVDSQYNTNYDVSMFKEISANEIKKEANMPLNDFINEFFRFGSKISDSDILRDIMVCDFLSTNSSDTSFGIMSNDNTVNTFIYGDAGFGSDAYMTTYNWNWWNGYWYNGASMFSGNQSMFYYLISLQYISAMKQIFNTKIEYLYRRRQRKLWMYSKPLVEGELICFEGTQVIDPDTDDSIWDSDWLKAYATALVGIQWGTNLTKFSNIPSAGGLTINADGILARYQQEKMELEEKHRLQYEEPPLPIFGGFSGV